MKKQVFCVAALWCAAGMASSVLAADKSRFPEKKQIERWAAMLPEKPRGLGPTIEDRKAWDAAASQPAFQECVKSANHLLKEPMPELTDDLYLEYSRTGNRTRCQQVQNQRFGRIAKLVLAECVENRGRFLPAIEEAILANCNDKSWMMPAHDRGLTTFSGKDLYIDLRVADVAWNLATADYWLGEKLRPETRKRIHAELERRVFQPLERWLAIDLMSKKWIASKIGMWWMTGENNWNAVCLAGVTGSALATIESRDRRALFAAVADKYIRHFLNGFTSDGYCSEGVGYWNYGFGHYVMLAETLKQATGGKADWMERPQITAIAQYANRVEILPGIFPPFADCRSDAKPDVHIVAMLSRRFGWGLADIEQQGLGMRSVTPGLFGTALYCFPNSLTNVPTAKSQVAGRPPRDWFADAQVLICRSASNQKHPFGVAMKGGHNAEQHNHNDIGSYVVALDRSTPLTDPGSEVYTRRTFSGQRYESKVLNSFGHAVPRVAGRLQEVGREAAARVLKTDFTDQCDTLAIDLSAAYKVKPLKKLERTFVYSREGRGSLVVTDAVEFETPQTFETALITFDKWTQVDAEHLKIGEGANAVTVEIAIEGGDFTIVPEEIHEDLHGHRVPIRIAIKMAKPTAKASVAVRIVPEG